MNALNFPRPKVPLAPILDLNFFRRSSISRSEHCILNVKNTRFTTSGRAAIALALEHANITPNDDVLIPAYHCESMIAPATKRGANVVFYKINPDTSIQLDDIKKKITAGTKAVIVTHYFGFEQSLREIKALCAQEGAVLIEDCAHAFFGASDNLPIGTTGDYAVASCMKFLPIYEGGLICSNTRGLTNLQLSAPSFIFQIKSFINTLELAVLYNRLGNLGKILNFLLNLKSALWAHVKTLRAEKYSAPLGPSSSDGGFGLDEVWIHKKISCFSKLIIRTSPLVDIAAKRRRNYQTINDALAALPGCHPLFKQLPEHTVPWVYPLYVNHPEKYFNKLKMQGIPIWRFGEFLDPSVTEKTCPVSVEYSRHIFQFPCHQSLSPQEIDWMLTQITKTFAD
jgi:dTDP-4-amino-4,6-dideoxygalactose transaminase